MRLGPVFQFNLHNPGHCISASNHLNLQDLDELKASISGDHDCMRPLKLCGIAWVGDAHGIAALLRGAVYGDRATSHCNADASALVAGDACNCSWRSWCSLIHQSDRSVALRPMYRPMFLVSTFY